MFPARMLAALLGAAAVAAGLAGCGITNPYQPPAHPRVTTSAIGTVTADQAPTDTAQSQGQVAALTRYALAEINWTAATLGADQRRLAQLASGPARAMALQAAASYGSASQLQRSHVTNSGAVTSISSGLGPLRGQWVITTRETTTGLGEYQGLPAQAHIYYARLTLTPTGWQVTRWAPQD